MMKKIRIFISSVQKEFSEERKLLFEYLISDPLLGKFFKPFLFDLLPSIDQSTQPLYLTGYIERKGTGTSDIVQKSLAAGLREPQFIQDEDFRTIIYRTSSEKVTDQVRTLILNMEKEYSRTELMGLLKLKHGQTFRENYLNPALLDLFIEMTQPESPNSPTQKYRLTEKGRQLKKILEKK
ncbi:MAG TPA: hypothetical protein PKC30_08650 [Saprospiraceae bacterium]|nr:hypothetical protein [Saprospiraceae bacterium]